MHRWNWNASMDWQLPFTLAYHENNEFLRTTQRAISNHQPNIDLSSYVVISAHRQCVCVANAFFSNLHKQFIFMSLWEASAIRTEATKWRIVNHRWSTLSLHIQSNIYLSNRLRKMCIIYVWMMCKWLLGRLNLWAQIGIKFITIGGRSGRIHCLMMGLCCYECAIYYRHAQTHSRSARKKALPCIL